MSLRARTSVLDTWEVENMMDSWASRDSVGNGSDVLDTICQIVALLRL